VPGLQPARSTLIPGKRQGLEAAAARREEHPVRHGENSISGLSPFSVRISIHGSIAPMFT
jgi:hypothetical protein